MSEQKKEVLTEGWSGDFIIIYFIVQRLLKKVTDWPAFKHGLIDKDGNLLRKPKTQAERDSFTPLDRFLLYLKKKMPTSVLIMLASQFMSQRYTNEAKEARPLEERLEDNVKFRKTLNRVMMAVHSEYEDEDQFWEKFVRSHTFD